MNRQIQLLSQLNIKSNLVFGKDAESFPDPALVGMLTFKSGILYLYTDIGDGILTWYPLTSKKNSFIHFQGSEAIEWTVNHQLDSTDVIVGVYDNENIQIQPAEIKVVDGNQVLVSFATAITGRVIIFAELSSSNGGFSRLDMGFY